MIKIFLDAGHGGADSGANGNGLREKDINLRVCNKIIELANKEGLISITPSRTTDVTLSLSTRVLKEKSSNYDASVSIHCNASNGAGYGTETFYYSSSKEGKDLATKVNDEVHAVMQRRNRGIKIGNSLALINGTKSTAILVELGFIDNKLDAEKLKSKTDDLAEAVYKGIKTAFNVKTDVVKPTIGTPIITQSKASVEQMVKFLESNNHCPLINCSIEELCQTFLEEGEIEGVAGDIAFCQAIKESGWFRFGGDVLPEQNNFCGLGTTSNGVKGNYFETPRLGIRAQIQHLQAYACEDELEEVCVDPRYKYVDRGSAKTWEQLNGKWAVPGNDYGQDILRLHKSLLKVEPEEDYVIEIKVGSRDKALELLKLLKNARIQGE